MNKAIMMIFPDKSGWDDCKLSQEHLLFSFFLFFEVPSK